MNEKESEVICIHCNYKWLSGSKMKYVTCPNCQKKTVILEAQNE